MPTRKIGRGRQTAVASGVAPDAASDAAAKAVTGVATDMCVGRKFRQNRYYLIAAISLPLPHCHCGASRIIADMPASNVSKPARYSKPKSEPAAPRRGWLGRGFGRLLLKTTVFCAGLGLCGALAATLAITLAWPNLPDLSAMIDYRPRVPLRIYTADKVLIGEFGTERRNVLRFDEIPDVMKSAILSAEDDRFYQHRGIDWMGVARATLANLVTLSKAQGASTITMQVARNFYLSSDKNFTRKFYELLLTLKIEATLSKDQILDLYMNQIYLGQRAYGFAAASRTYFGKQLTDITTAEAAMLAGLPKAPSRYNPITNLERAKIRQQYVLGRMRLLGYLTEDEYQQALAQDIVIKSAPGTPAGGYAIHAEYVAELARQLLYNVYQDNVYSRGFNIYTTIRSEDQQAAWQAVREGVLTYTRRSVYPGPETTVALPARLEADAARFDALIDDLQERWPDHNGLLMGVVLSVAPNKIVVARSAGQIVEVTHRNALAVVARGLDRQAEPPQKISRGAVVYLNLNQDASGRQYWEIINRPLVQAAFVSLRPQDGAIMSLVGGFDFQEKFNRVTQAWRQPGSLFKPFIYASALERGLTPDTQISDEPIMFTAEQTGSTEDWMPKNYNDVYDPMLTLREGLYKSRNMVSIRVMQAIGPQYVQDYISRFGFERSRHPAVLSLALGAGSVTPLQLASGYAVFANGGYRVLPYLIDHVTDSTGKVIMQSRPVVAGDAAARAIDPRTAFVMNDMMQDVVKRGTAVRVRETFKRRDLGGKTGTTNQSRDAWFAGYTPQLVGVTWVGFDQPRSLGEREAGSGTPLTIWMRYMQTALARLPETPPAELPPGLLQYGNKLYFSEFPPGKAVARVGLPVESDVLYNGDALAIDASQVNPHLPGDSVGELIRQIRSQGYADEASSDSQANSQADTQVEARQVQF